MSDLAAALALLKSFQAPDQAELLDEMPAEDSAGGLMTTEFLALRRRTTAVDALASIRDWQPKSDTLSGYL